MNKLALLVSRLGKEDLKRLKKDLDEGNLQRLIEKRLRELEDSNKVCPVCGAKVGEDSIELRFGRRGLRKRARFCGQDCLEYFLREMKEKGLRL